MENCVKTKDKAKRVHKPKRENAGNMKFKKAVRSTSLAKLVAKKKVTRKKLNQKGRETNSAKSKIMEYLYKCMPEYLSKYFKKNSQKEGNAKKGRKKKADSNDKIWKILGAVFFVSLLVVVFVGSAVGFSKCETGFRNVHQVSQLSSKSAKCNLENLFRSFEGRKFSPAF